MALNRPKTRREINLEKKIRELEAILADERNDTARLRSGVEAAIKDAVTATAARKEDDVRALVTQVNKLRSNLDIRKGDTEYLRDRLAAAKTEKAALVQQLNQTVFDRDRSRNRVDTVESMLNDLRNEKRRLVRRLDKFENPKLTEVQVQLIDIAEKVVPVEMMEPTREIITDRLMRETLESLMERKDEIGSTEQMLLIGIGMNPMARRHFDAHLDAYWGRAERSDVRRYFSDPRMAEREVIVGAGVHGAITAAVRHQKTGVKPLVIDKGRAGGSFAVSKGPSFFLNSRNRPGRLSIPGDVFGALNVLPGAPIQPSQVSGDEYLTNDALAWVVRSTLLMHADVMTEIPVGAISGYSSIRNILYVDDLGSWYIGKAFVATGLTNPRKAFNITDDRYMGFEDFMRRMDGPYPLRGMKQVAVIGAGDGGKTVIEALTGQGPTTGLSIPTLDYPEIIDWFGVPADRRTRASWESCNRSRYKGIGRLLEGRVMAYDNPQFVDAGYDSIRVNGKAYDYVIDCTGYAMDKNLMRPEAVIRRDGSEGQALGFEYGSIYYVGPSTKLPEERTDSAVLRGIGENTTSIFRYADRTARLASLV